MEKIKVRSLAQESDALVIMRHDRPLIQQEAQYCGGLDSMELTKPIIALALALLVDEGRISCFDAPLYTFYPSWNVGYYKKITLRHLLSNTSGMANQVNLGLYETPLAAILNAPLFFVPGTKYYKNPSAMQLLIGIVKIVSGKELQEYLREKLFEPLAIENVCWRSAEASSGGLPQFKMSALDLAKIGSMIAGEGYYKGKQIVSKRWIKELLSPSQAFDPFFGMQWWLEFYDIAAWWDDELLQSYCENGISMHLIDLISDLQGRVINFSGQIYGSHIVKLRGLDLINFFDNGQLMAELILETSFHGLPLARFKPGKLKMISAHGRGGQHLIILPSEGLVAVRQRHVDYQHFCPQFDFDDLPDLLAELATAYSQADWMEETIECR